ncbi:peptidoglycan-binding domain-containing protein [Rhodopila sp.]|uniref:peptidoglycan-binding domain-containing protein n=1 Tax=Rhodopila sp. TaxID=2480087 RepID=UPI003D1371C5
MNTWRYGIAVGVVAGLGACSNMMGHNSASEAPKASMAATEPTVSPDMVKQVQAKLRANGYYKQGNVDGVWGSGTESAVRSFQKDHNLGSSGQLDVSTLQALNVTRSPTASTDTTTPNSTTPNGSASTNAGMNNANANNANTNSPGTNNPGTNNPGTPAQPSNANPADNTAPGPSH